jgi:hypothetical protein
VCPAEVGQVTQAAERPQVDHPEPYDAAGHDGRPVNRRRGHRRRDRRERQGGQPHHGHQLRRPRLGDRAEEPLELGPGHAGAGPEPVEKHQRAGGVGEGTVGPVTGLDGDREAGREGRGGQRERREKHQREQGPEE